MRSGRPCCARAPSHSHGGRRAGHRIGVESREVFAYKHMDRLPHRAYPRRMAILKCRGLGCPRLISWSQDLGRPNPVALDSPELFAIESYTCQTCGGLFCDRCSGSTTGRKSLACPTCGGPLASSGYHDY